ncbi:hypothetical protein Dimus_016682 [Dionaea muscipula]
MDDSCAVCADTLEWVACGPCGHRDVCSTCVARLRFICDDNRCCICKSECNVVFVTKALGDYTRMISDFSTLPSVVREGKFGSYWYHEDTQAFFDDMDQYKMIKAMCRLSCSVCEKAEENTDGFQRRRRFRNIDQLKGHLFHQHKLHMCNLCLEGRKVFICEQKLYNRTQLDQHIRTGDSEVDGTETERGGFTGHPLCDFCRFPFYGDNELYTHMSTEHYTCHICQRQHPGQYEYYRNYDDLETHFRKDHFLCEDETCLAKKFIVFQSDTELKRHNALEHGGRMSRSKRNAVLQIPTSFRYRSGNESGNRRGRGRSFHRESRPDNQLDMAIQASLETAALDGRTPHTPAVAELPEVADTTDVDPLFQPFESLTTSDSEHSARYREALSHNSRNGPLQESYFPPLSTASSSSQHRTQHDLDGFTQNTMAARLRRKNKVNVLNTAQAWAATSRRPAAVSSSSIQPHPVINNMHPSASGSVVSNVATPNELLPSVRVSGAALPPSTYAGSVLGGTMINHGAEFGASSVSRNLGNSSRVQRSSLASNLTESRSFDPVSDFPAITEMKSFPSSGNSMPMKVDDVQSANKSLIEKIRGALDDDEEKYAAFKVISQEYRQGSIDTWSYLEYVKQFGLSHLVLDLARLCPDAQKQKELIDTHNATLRSIGSEETFWGNGKLHAKGSGSSKKDKGKKVADAEKKSSSKDSLADNVMSAVRRLQSDNKPVEGEVEVLEKDGYRACKGKSLIIVEEKPIAIGGAVSTQKELSLAGRVTGQSSGDQGGGGSKRGKKKTPKFQRVRLGDGSVGAVSDLGSSGADPSLDDKEDASAGQSSSTGLPTRGVWHNGGGHKLFASTDQKTMNFA